MLVWIRAYVQGYFECQYMCKSSFFVKASAVAPITTGNTASSAHSFWKKYVKLCQKFNVFKVLGHLC